MSDLKKYLEAQLQDPEFREYYDDNKVFADIAKAMVSGRMKKNLTQKELAKVSGVPQANISRYENCEKDMSVNTLKRIAKALDLRVQIEFIPISLEDASEE